ncbi:hypothetical protein [Thalassomonas sp. RHCl1]|uniref:hypothetical protein n=1 Tax=Thalassomonas sp. RHCl1 TaxID=2995320 RepID=UPI00248CB022|nr:hypothetical protein [Thalassomonas sp. RHCl1]
MKVIKMNNCSLQSRLPALSTYDKAALYYMEYISVEFSKEGESVKQRLQEVLLAKGTAASEKSFWETCNPL